MPSTYSPDLRIELIANGEQSGTWGSTTNNNLGTILEDAISGVANVNVISANQALTAYNGAVDEARNAVIKLSTTTGASFSVYVPPVTKSYVVFNSSAQTATIYCSTVIGNTIAAGTGVAVPAGKSVLLRSDGTNIVEQLNHVTGTLSVGGTASLNGAVAVGGTLTATSPVFSGVPVAPTAAAGTSTTQIATTAFVTGASGNKLGDPGANGLVSRTATNTTTARTLTSANGGITVTNGDGVSGNPTVALNYATDTVLGAVRVAVSGTTLNLYTTA